MRTIHADGLPRCAWVGQDPIYVSYHDEEWGVPEYDDRALFEKLVLDGFQAGLSWITILRKRDNFRRAFDAFDPVKIARYKPAFPNYRKKSGGQDAFVQAVLPGWSGAIPASFFYAPDGRQIGHLLGEAVQLLGAVERDGRDVVGDVELDGG